MAATVDDALNDTTVIDIPEGGRLPTRQTNPGEKGMGKEDPKFPWTVKKGRRSTRMDKWEQMWFQRWGLSNECSICGENHPAMNKIINDEGGVRYDYNCPIATNDQWPPLGSGDEDQNMWNSLDASPRKMASHHGYNLDAIIEALGRWEHHGAGLLVTPEECESFKSEVHLRCEVERQAWTFKRTLLVVYGLEEESDENLEEDNKGILNLREMC